MIRRITQLLATMTTALAVAPAALGGGPIIPPGTEVFSGDLDPVPHTGIADGGSNVNGSVSIIKTDTTVRVTIVARGLELGLSHLQNIAGVGLSQCPPASADTSGDGLIALEEALPFAGPLVLPLTLASDPLLSPTAGQTLGIRPPGASGPGRSPGPRASSSTSGFSSSVRTSRSRSRTRSRTTRS